MNETLDITDRFTVRLLEQAFAAEKGLPPVEIILALLGVAINYALRRAPEPEVVAILRQTADKLEAQRAPRGPAN